MSPEPPQTAEELAIPIEHPELDTLSAVLNHPTGPERGAAILLAHGAGADMHSEFMLAVAEGLAARGFAVLRFRYPYMERAQREGRRRPPDRAPILEHAHAAALAELRRRVPGRRVLLAGKSMGGRMGTHLAAKGADCAGLVLFGYPLHPPGKPEKERSEHFPAIVQPALFLQGTRDKLCELELLQRALHNYGGRPTLEIIEGADHGFAVLRRTGLTAREVWDDLLGRVDSWERLSFP